MLATWPTPWSIGLCTAAPNPDGTGIVEPSVQDGYARQPFTDYDQGQLEGITTLTNTTPIVFGPAQNPWVTVNYFVLFDAVGVMRVYGRLRTSRNVPTGKTESFGAGSVALRLR